MKAVIDLRNEQSDFWAVGRFRDFDRHAELIVGKFLKGRGLLVDLPRGRPLYSLEEDIGRLILMLIRVMNITAT